MSILSVIGTGVSSFFGLRHESQSNVLTDEKLRIQINYLETTVHKLKIHFNKKEYSELKICARGIENSVRQLKNHRYNIYLQHIQEDMDSLITEIDLFKAKKINEEDLRIFISRFIRFTTTNIKNLQ